MTHDYLVHSLRDWLTRKQRETRRGRAELRLATITSSWRDRPELRRLPSPLEWIDILAYTRSASWSEAERQMMHAATRHYTVRALGAATIVAALSLASLEYRRRVRAEGLVSKLLVADTNQVSAIIREIEEDPRRTWHELDRIARDPQRSSKERLHASLALGPIDAALDDYLFNRLLESDPDELILIVERLRTRSTAFVNRVWNVTSDVGADRKRKLRAASALAWLDPGSGRWKELAQVVSGLLVLDENALRLERWLDALRPVSKRLIGPLAAIYRDRSRTEDERFSATIILEQYAADDPDVLVNLIKDADLRQYVVLLPVLKHQPIRVKDLLEEELEQQPPVGASEEAKNELASQQANCAVTLLLLDPAAAPWPLLQQSPEPYLRGHLLDRIEPMGVDSRMLVERLRVEKETSARRAVTLALADCRGKGLPSAERAGIEQDLLASFQNDPDPGIHSAAERLLRNWGHGDQVNAVVESLRGKRPDRGRRWYVNRERHTMVIIDPRGTDPALSGGKRIDRVYSIATKEVSVKQFLEFRSRVRRAPQHSPTTDCPINAVTWYEAAAYCRWLSEREGLEEEEMCYPPIAEIKEGMHLPPNYLKRTGYRLQTEAEAEFACRAGAVTSRSFGSSDKLLPRYAYFFENSRDRTWPVGSLRPNDLGMFDALGNVMEWCQESRSSVSGNVDREDLKPVSNQTERCLRGGAYGKLIHKIRSDRAEHLLPASTFNEVGFRVARTQRSQP